MQSNPAPPQPPARPNMPDLDLPKVPAPDIPPVDDIQIIPDQGMPPDAAPHMAPPQPTPTGYAAQPDPNELNKSSRWTRKRKIQLGIGLGTLALLLTGGLTTTWFVVQQDIEDAKVATNEFTTAFNRGEAVAPFFDTVRGCSMDPSVFPTLDQIGPIGWTVENVAYSLNFGEGPSTWNLNNHLDEAGLVAIDRLASSKPPGTDYAVVFGQLTQHGETTQGAMFMVREPGRRWLVCGIDDDTRTDN